MRAHNRMQALLQLMKGLTSSQMSSRGFLQQQRHVSCIGMLGAQSQIPQHPHTDLCPPQAVSTPYRQPLTYCVRAQPLSCAPAKQCTFSRTHCSRTPQGVAALARLCGQHDMLTLTDPRIHVPWEETVCSAPQEGASPLHAVSAACLCRQHVMLMLF